MEAADDLKIYNEDQLLDLKRKYFKNDAQINELNSILKTFSRLKVELNNFYDHEGDEMVKKFQEKLSKQRLQ